jgi:hypothetical protein
MTEFYQWVATQPVFVQVALGLAVFMLGVGVVAGLFVAIGGLFVGIGEGLSAGEPAKATPAEPPDPAKKRKEFRESMILWGVILAVFAVLAVFQGLRTQG